MKYGTPVYRYWFDHAAEEYGAWGPNYTECEGYACHGIELVFVFGTDFAFHISFSADEQVLTTRMMDYWGNFVNTGNPNTPTQPALPCKPFPCFLE
jgi:carboxylesterase type B